MFTHVGGDLPCDFAAIERFPAALGQQLVGCGQARVTENLALAGCGPVRQEAVGKSGVIGQHPGIGCPCVGGQLGYRKPFLSQRDGRDEQFSKFLAAVSSVQFKPAVHGARRRNRQGTEWGDVLQAAFAKSVPLE